MQNTTFPPQVFGQYLLTERIGSGGMAEVFRATTFGIEGFSKEVCIKRILPTLSTNESFVKMFVGEAKITVSLHHANIVQVLDLGKIGEHYFIAMELIRGRNFLQVINRFREKQKTMPVPIAVAILCQVCLGLECAHHVKISGKPLDLVHRDITPSNILISWDGEVKITDFGIAKADLLTEENTTTGATKGKHGYMSPEQVTGALLDHRSDIFGAGILLYEALVGARLFKGETNLQTLEKVRAAVITPLPSAANPEVSWELEQILLRALSKNPADRFQTAGEFHEALSEWCRANGHRSDSKTISDFMHAVFSAEVRTEEKKEQNSKIILETVPLPNQYGTAPNLVSSWPPLSGLSAIPEERHSHLRIALWAIGCIVLFAMGALLLFWMARTKDPSSLPPSSTTLKSTGAVILTSSPEGASIEVDGVLWNQKTPTTIKNLSRRQSHFIRLTLPQYEPWAKTIQFGNLELIALEAQLISIPRRK